MFSKVENRFLDCGLTSDMKSTIIWARLADGNFSQVCVDTDDKRRHSQTQKHNEQTTRRCLMQHS